LCLIIECISKYKMVLNNFVLRYVLFTDILYIFSTIMFSFVAFNFNRSSFSVLIRYVKKRRLFFVILYRLQTLIVRCFALSSS